MSGFEWRRSPIGLDPNWWMTRGTRQTVLVVVGSAALGQPLLDVARIAAEDPRLRVVFALPPGVAGVSGAETEGLLRSMGTVVLPWAEAGDNEFGLVIAAASPALPYGPRAPLIVLGWGAYELAMGRGSVAFATTHTAEWPASAGEWVRARQTRVVVGDSVHDRLVASLPLRDFYRRALGVAPGQKLVTVALSPARRAGGGPCEGYRDVVRRLLTELPPEEYYVLGIPQPELYGHRVCGATIGRVRDGLGLMPPEADWRAALVAADWIIGDHHGPVAYYGTVIGVPVILSGSSMNDMGQPGLAADLSEAALHLSPHRPIRAQLNEAAGEWRPDRAWPVVERITSEPGRFVRNMRRLMYRLLSMPQPATIPVAEPISPPFRLGTPAEHDYSASSGG
jgi:hypothetical protein